MEDKIIHTTYTSFGLLEPEPAIVKWNNFIQSCKDNDKDFYTEIASRLYRVPYEEVTSEQQAGSKHYFIGVIYSRGAMVEPPERIT